MQEYLTVNYAWQSYFKITHVNAHVGG